MYRSIIYDKPDFIYIADTHIRSSIPKCRIDDFLIAQENKLKFIFDLMNIYDCPLIVGGDFGHKSEWKNWLLCYLIIAKELTTQSIYIIPGQHDLPYHELNKWKESGIGVLNFSNIINVLIKKPIHFISNDEKTMIRIIPCPYNLKISTKKYPKEDRNILVTHRMIIDKPLWPGQKAKTGYQLLKKYPMYDAILSGDNHQSFIHRYENRILVNSGSLMRTTTEQKNHKPKAYLYYAKRNTVCPVYIPIEKNVINTEHIKEKKNREKRIESYISYIEKLKHKKKYPIILSFKKNINSYLDKSNHKKPVKKLVKKHTKGD